MSWDIHTGMWGVPRCWTMTENVMFQNWPFFFFFFLLFFPQYALISLALFFALYLSTLRLWMYLSSQVFHGVVWDFTLPRSPRQRLRLSYMMNTYFSSKANISISLFPLPLSHHSLTPQLCQFQCCVGNKSQNTSRLKIAEKERERNEFQNSDWHPTCTSKANTTELF